MLVTLWWSQSAARRLYPSGYMCTDHRHQGYRAQPVCSSVTCPSRRHVRPVGTAWRLCLRAVPSPSCRRGGVGFLDLVCASAPSSHKNPLFLGEILIRGFPILEWGCSVTAPSHWYSFKDCWSSLYGYSTCRSRTGRSVRPPAPRDRRLMDTRLRDAPFIPMGWLEEPEAR